MITNSTGTACEKALRSVLTAHGAGRKVMEDTINECRLALSLLVDGAPTVEELKPFIGSNWAICRATKRARARYDNCLSPAAFRKAEIKAIATRLGLSEGFVSVRV